MIQPAGSGTEWPKDRSLFDMITAQLAVGLAHARALQQLQNRFSRLQAQFQSPEPTSQFVKGATGPKRASWNSELRHPARNRPPGLVERANDSTEEQTAEAASQQARIKTLQEQVQKLEAELEQERRPAEMEDQQVRIKTLQEQVEKLEAELEQERRPAEMEDQQARIKTLQEQVAKLEAELNREHRPALADTPPALDQEQVESLAEELRQPVASISGYTDLLLGGSVGSRGRPAGTPACSESRPARYAPEYCWTIWSMRSRHG